MEDSEEAETEEVATEETETSIDSRSVLFHTTPTDFLLQPYNLSEK